MINKYDEYIVYKNILIEKFFSIKTNHKINELNDLKDRLEYFLYYVKNEIYDMSELEDLLLVVKYVIKAKYIKNMNNSTKLIEARHEVSSLWERLISMKNENKQWSIRETRYVNILLAAYPEIDELIELFNYSKQQIINYHEKNEISKQERNNFIISLQNNVTLTLFDYKFRISIKNNIPYENKGEIYDYILNSNLDEMLKNNEPTKDNMVFLISANCLKAILSKEIDYIRNAMLLIKQYKAYYAINYIKNYIIKYEKDLSLYNSYMNLCLYQ